MASKYISTKFSCYVGYVVQAVVNNFLPILFIALQDVYGLGYEKLARLILFNFAAQMVTDILSPHIIDRIGYRASAFLSQATAALGLVMLSFLPRVMSNTYLAIIISVIVYAVGSGLMEVIISPIVEMLPTGDKSGNMAFLHSFYCWGQAFTVTVTTFLVFVFGYSGWANIPAIWAVIPFINMFSFLKVPIVEPDKTQKTKTLRQLLKSPRFIGYMVMMFCAGAAEIAMAEWASMFIQQALGVSKVIGDLAGPCAFALFMGTGRIWYAKVSHNISFKKTLIILSIMCFICYLVVAVCKIAAVSLVFCAVCGFTVSVFWPAILSAAAKDFPTGGTALFSVIAMCGDTGCCLGPWSLGIIADNFGLNVGFAAMTVFPIGMIITLCLKNKDCKMVRQDV